MSLRFDHKLGPMHLHDFNFCNFCVVVRVFIMFKEKHPDVMVQLTTFSNLKPWFMKHQKEWGT